MPFYDQGHVQGNSLAASFCNGGWHVHSLGTGKQLDKKVQREVSDYGTLMLESTGL
jgi:hypothetical protein